MREEVLKHIVSNTFETVPDHMGMDNSGKCVFFMCDREIIPDYSTTVYFPQFMPYVKCNGRVFSEINYYHFPKNTASKHSWLTIQ